MFRYWFIFAGGAALMLTGCSSVDTQEKEIPRQELADPWSEEDSFKHTENVSGSSRLPLAKISPRQKISLKLPIYLEDKLDIAAKDENKPEAAALLDEYDRKKSGSVADLDKIVCKVLEFLAFNEMKVPFNERYVIAGIEIAAASKDRFGHRFAPAPEISRLDAAYEKLEKAQDPAEVSAADRIVVLYAERSKLHKDIIMWLKDCGLARKDMHWIPLFTYLELELLGIEQEYKKLIPAGNR